MSEKAPGVFPGFALAMMLLFFVLSGISGLIYQSIWSQYLGLVLGHAAYAQSLVLSTFMGGMALGAWLASRILGRLGSLFRAYGLLEGVIGVFGLVFHAIFLATSGWLFDSWLPGISSQTGSDFSRYALALALILPQTVLLGMTFPVMSAGLIRWQPSSAGRVLGGLYFFNSIGAALGALLATFYLIPVAGLPGAMTFAGILNLLVAVLVLLLRVPPRPVSDDIPQGPVVAGGEQQSLLRFVLVAALVTGAASFMYEIGWVRMLSLALGSSLHSFELMLAAFIGGLAFGGWFIRNRLDRITAPLRYVGWVQVFMGLSALLTLPLYNHSFEFVSWILASLARSDGGYTLYNLATAAVSITIMVPAAFFAGMTLPLMTYALLRKGVGEKAIGLVYAANTIGAILGVMLMVHVLMPALGLKLSMVLAGSIDIGLGLVILWRLGEDLRPGQFRLGLAVSGLAIALVIALAPFDPRRMVAGVYRTGIAQLDPRSEVTFLRDGKTASVAMYQQADGQRVIATNGKPDAALMMDPTKPPGPDEPTMIIAALLALSHNAEPRQIANIGFGSGLTSHVLASSTLPVEITNIEIEPAMVTAARGFGERVERAYLDPRSKIVFDDARAYFAGGAKTFDVIVSEPSNPWISGIAKLFSREFYEFIPRHLKPNGILVQWVQAYEISDQTLLSILAALDSRFADYRIYLSNTLDLLIVASPDAQLPALNPAVFADASLREVASRIGIENATDLSARLVANREMVRALLAVAQPMVNSDYFPTVAHTAPRDRFSGKSASAVSGFFLSPSSAMRLLDVAPPIVDPGSLTPLPENWAVATRRRSLATLAALGSPPDASTLGQISSADLAEVALLRSWGQSCFVDADPGLAVRMMTRLFRLSLARASVDEARARWLAPAWVVCGEGQQPPESVSLALATFALALDDDAGSKLLESATQVITTVRNLSPEALSEFYAMAMVGAARARSGDDIVELHRSTMNGLPMAPAERLQLNAIAQLAFLHASRPAD